MKRGRDCRRLFAGLAEPHTGPGRDAAVHRSIKADLALLLVAFCWGASFPVMKAALAHASPLLFLAVRFTLAAVLCLPMAPAFRQPLVPVN